MSNEYKDWINDTLAEKQWEENNNNKKNNKKKNLIFNKNYCIVNIQNEKEKK